MERLPIEILTRIFSCLPSLDLGRILSVCRGWNEILSNSPDLWNDVELPESIGFDQAHEIIQVFSDRSQSSLEVVIFPAALEDFQVAAMLTLLSPSRLTLRTILVNFSSVRPSESIFGLPSQMDLFMGCPKLEVLCLLGPGLRLGRSVGAGVPLQVEGIEGALTILSCVGLDPLPLSMPPGFLPNLKVLEWLEGYGPAFDEVLSICSDKLEVLKIGGQSHCRRDSLETQEGGITYRMSRLKALVLTDVSCRCGSYFPEISCPNLELISSSLKALPGSSSLKKLRWVHLELPELDEYYELEDRVEILGSLIEILESNQETLEALTLDWRHEGGTGYSIDEVLDYLRINIALGAPCPKLSALAIAPEINFSQTLLAEVLFGRNLLSKGYSYSLVSPRGIETQSNPHSCSPVVLSLGEEEMDDFKEAEEEVLSRCSEWMREAAGETDLHSQA